jgi:HPt (histidine-containing phosphotransfer) domain-containing protein
MTSAALLNINEIRQLVDDMGGDTSILPDLVDSLEVDFNRSIQEMHNAVENSDAKRLKQAAHRLKGGCASLGATLAATSCQELETLGQNGDIEEAASMVERLIGICTESITALRALSL